MMTLGEALDLTAQMEIPSFGAGLSEEALAPLRAQAAACLMHHRLSVPTWMGGSAESVEPVGMRKGRQIVILSKGRRITGPVAFLTNKEDGHVFPVSASDPKAIAAMNTPRHREIVEKIHAETTDPKKKAVHAEHLATLKKMAGDSAGVGASAGAEKASEASKPARKPFTPPSEGGAIARVSAVKQALYHGEISADELRAEFAHYLSNKDAFREELSKLKVADLKSMGAGGYYADRMKKNQLVDWMVEHTEDAYNPGSSISYNVMDPNGRANAIRNVLAKVTDEHIQERSAERKALVAKRDETRAKVRAALADPKTQEDFDLLREYNLLDRISPEHQRRYEDIKAEADRDKRIAAQQKAIADRGTIGQVQAATDITVVPGKHTKTGADIWTAKLTARVDSDRYAELNSAAKRLGGYYSRFGGGFIFDNESAANKFAGVTSGTVDATDVVQARAEDKVEQTTARLQELASRITERAQETLNADRQTNTARRADMAAGIEGRAREDLATAKTLQKIADGVGDGSLRHLSEIKHATQLETLRNAARRAQYAAIRKEGEDNGRGYSHVTENLGRPLQIKDIEHAEYPYPYVRHAKQVLAASKGKRGTKAAWARVNAEHQRQQREDPDSWGMKLGSTSLMSDYETLLGRVPNVSAKNSYSSPHRGYEESAADAKRLQRMGINTPGDMRAALREYVGLHQGADKPDALKEKMRDLVGRKIPGFFPTPAPTAQRMMRVANIQPGMTVLEPSAGTGNLADAARAAGGEVTALEQVSDLRDILNMKGHTVEGDNALEHDREYDRVVMNPPFEDGQDMEHVRHAFEKNLRPGGRLVAIMSEGPFFRGDKKAEAFREWLESHGGTSEKLPEGSFKESGTGVNTRLVTITKMAKGRGAIEPRTRQIVVMFKGDVSSMEPLTTGSHSPSPAPRSGRRRFITEDEVRARARELSIRQRSREFIQRIHDGTQDPAKKAAHAARLEAYGPALAPPPGRQRKEKPFTGSITFQGIPIAIESEKGTWREGVGRDGKPWRVKMNAHYGEIHGWGTLGTDGDKLDAYVGPVADASHAYVIDQLHPDSGAFDEQKVMLGFPSESAAKAAYLAQFDKPGFYGGIHPIPMDVLKAKLRDKGLRGQPISHGRPVVVLSSSSR